MSFWRVRPNGADRQWKEVENAPGFDKDNWPDMTDITWGERVHKFYGQVPYWTERKAVGR